MRNFIWGRRVELLVALLLLIGAALIIDVGALFGALGNAFVSMSQLPLATVLGAGLIGLALVIIGWQARVRFLRSNFWRVTVCPRCQSPLHRVHRRWSDRMLGKVLLPHSRRYRCSNSACGWTGLRHSRRHD